MACSYCYARRMYKRFKWNPEISYRSTDWMNREINRIDNRRGEVGENARIFIGSTMELFGDWIRPSYLQLLFKLISAWSEHTFIFLTKQPQNLLKWSPFPENCWVGVSASDTPNYQDAYRGLAEVEAKVRFISFEPLLGAIYTQGLCALPPYYNPRGFPFDWLIIGSQTQPVKHPRREWVEEILESADKAQIPVFVKEPLASHLNIHREEWPK